MQLIKQSVSHQTRRAVACVSFTYFQLPISMNGAQ
jgi:hypothetical protein